jgi:transcription elongation factor GreA
MKKFLPLAPLLLRGAGTGVKATGFLLRLISQLLQSGFMEKIILTRAGYEKLIRELEFLSRVERPQVIQEILEAAQEGRVEKNPDFQFVLAHRRQLERRIKQLQQTLANAEVLVGSNLSSDKVRFNARVRVVNLNTGQEREFRIVGPLEADAAAGHLSLASPLGRALLGRAVGDRIQVQTPRGVRSYQVLEIHMEQV